MHCSEQGNDDIVLSKCFLSTNHIRSLQNVNAKTHSHEIMCLLHSVLAGHLSKGTVPLVASNVPSGLATSCWLLKGAESLLTRLGVGLEVRTTDNSHSLRIEWGCVATPAIVPLACKSLRKHCYQISVCMFLLISVHKHCYTHTVVTVSTPLLHSSCT